MNQYTKILKRVANIAKSFVVKVKNQPTLKQADSTGTDGGSHTAIRQVVHRVRFRITNILFITRPPVNLAKTKRKRSAHSTNSSRRQ